VSSTGTRQGRHRLALDGPRADHRAAAWRPAPDRRPSLVPRSVTVVAATVGAVLALGVDQELPLPAPHPDASVPSAAGPALEPVVPVRGDGPPARVASVPTPVTGQAIAGAHGLGFASLPVAAP
jgi:hypothetical protein